MEEIPPEAAEPAHEQEYNVRMPQEMVVYYDTVLDQTVTVRDVDSGNDGFVTYHTEGGPENMVSEPMNRFLAWLAAGRFVKLGDRMDAHGIDAYDEDIANVFAEAYGYDPREFRPLELARFLLAERLDETLVMEDDG